jgi:hypothetical protein
MRALRPAIKRLLGERALGVIDYLRSPVSSPWGGPFNGQPARQRLFAALVERCDPWALVETGTYRGATAEFMAQTGRPVFTVEVDARTHAYARLRLRRHRNVTPLCGDSRPGLRSLFAGPLRAAADRTIFAYLDAHWNSDLPLAEEVDMIFTHCPAAIVMIDDFQVPFDAGYGYDDYGAGQALTARYIASAVADHGLSAFYPSTPSSEEGGACRGCILLAKDARHGSALKSMPLLRASESFV